MIYIYNMHIPNYSYNSQMISQRYPPFLGPFLACSGPRATDGCHCHGPSDDDAATQLQMDRGRNGWYPAWY